MDIIYDDKCEDKNPSVLSFDRTGSIELRSKIVRLSAGHTFKIAFTLSTTNKEGLILSKWKKGMMTGTDKFVLKVYLEDGELTMSVMDLSVFRISGKALADGEKHTVIIELEERETNRVLKLNIDGTDYN